VGRRGGQGEKSKGSAMNTDVAIRPGPQNLKDPFCTHTSIMYMSFLHCLLHYLITRITLDHHKLVSKSHTLHVTLDV
jgi:hypothetical protein